MSPREELERCLGRLPGLTVRRSRYGNSPAYFAGEREIAHFHSDGRMDVRLTRGLLRERRQAGTLDPRVRTRGPSADWASVSLEDLRDVPFAVELVEEAVRASA